MPRAAVPQAIDLEKSVQFLRGVGPVRAKLFERLGVVTVGDLIELYPFRYEHKPRSQAIGSLHLDQTATIVGEIRGLRPGARYGSRPIRADVIDGTGMCRVSWFNSAFLLEKLHNGSIVRLTGKVDLRGKAASMVNPRTLVIDRSEGDPLVGEQDEFEPVYPATEGLGSRDVRRVVESVLESAVASVREILPDRLRLQRKLPPRPTAILRYHRPTSPSDAEVARQRLAYDELLFFQLALQLSRAKGRKSAAAAVIEISHKVDERIRRRIPFKLTSGQDKAIAEISADLARPVPMNRLLQADVGAGKTAVAVYASLAVVAARTQVALLAPTEILAAQHREKVEQYLQGSRVNIGYLSASTGKRERTALLRGLAGGEVNWLIGTHAILEPDVRFRNLSLVIIDEQHKFGVSQRAALKRKSAAPHTLVLTATPIPRSLAMTLFGDLDISTIHDRPPGRQPIVTRLVTPENTAKAWGFVRDRLKRGEQAYVVYPLVEESESIPLKAAAAEVERLSREELEGFKIALLHGRMKPAEKAGAMNRFRSGDVKVLAATTVIEVGVDVPNATLMLVQHAERYGLSQLHQLRGRIGRGNRKSFCFLFADPGRDGAIARLSILCETDDGFRIAEKDLILRGPGELLGTRQHGMPVFNAADLARDLSLLQTARDDAADLLREDPSLDSPDHANLKAEVQKRFGRKLRLSRIG